MELTPHDDDLFEDYLTPVLALAGDRRTRALLGGTVRGIVASGSLVVSRIAAFSPLAGRRGA